MPRYYCDYCDTYLTHDSPSVRKQHNSGYKHKSNVRTYYQQFEEQQTQSLIDQRIKEHLGQAAVFQQVGAAYAAMQRFRPPQMMPMPGLAPPGAQLIPSMRPPVLPRPLTALPGYGAPPTMPTNGPPSFNIPSSIPGSTTNPSSMVVPSSGMQPMYHGAPNFALPSFSTAADGTTAPNHNQ